MNTLVTGAAGFIGAAFCARLLARGGRVTGVDNFSDYYDVDLKRARLVQFQEHENFTFHQADITDRGAMEKLFGGNRFDAVAHFAAQAGVRYSLENPAAYVDTNIAGFGNIIENCRRAGVGHLLFASSSSVYGGGAKLPFSESEPVDRPLSPYAASKRANELMAYCYAHLYGLPCTGLRFFTVYGPWGRPDMAFFKFADLMLRGEPIPVYRRGELTRDFTYIDDAVESALRALDAPPAADDASGGAPCRIYNIGNGREVRLRDYIRALEDALGLKASWKMLPMQPGDATATHADMRAFREAFGFTPETSVEEGLAKFAEWYRAYRQPQ